MKVEYILINESTDNTFCTNVNTLNNYLQSDSNIQINNNKFKTDGYVVDYTITSDKAEISNEVIFYICFTSNDADDKVNVQKLEKVSRCFRSAVKKQKDFILNTIWDGVSHYYCENCYPIINEVENLMRKLITQFMIKKIGSRWVEKVFPPNFKDHIENKRNINEIFEDILYESDFIQLSTFLFEPYSNKQINDIFNKIDEIKEIKDIEAIKEFKPKSNWDRYFSNIDTLKRVEKKGVENDWKKLYDLRNKVAHNKLFNKQNSEELIRLSNNIKDKILKAISNFDKVNVPEEDKEDIAKSVFNIASAGSIYSWTNAPTIVVGSSIPKGYTFLEQSLDLNNNTNSILMFDTKPLGCINPIGISGTGLSTSIGVGDIGLSTSIGVGGTGLNTSIGIGGTGLSTSIGVGSTGLNTLIGVGDSGLSKSIGVSGSGFGVSVDGNVDILGITGDGSTGNILNKAKSSEHNEKEDINAELTKNKEKEDIGKDSSKKK